MSDVPKLVSWRNPSPNANISCRSGDARVTVPTDLAGPRITNPPRVNFEPEATVSVFSLMALGSVILSVLTAKTRPSGLMKVTRRLPRKEGQATGGSQPSARQRGLAGALLR